jgi:hypothetical protein
MASTQFDNLLAELGPLLKLPEMRSNNKNTSMLKYNNGINVQLELDRLEQHLIMGADLGDLPLGRYREIIFKAALLANGNAGPRYGILSFSMKANRMVIFERFPIDSVKASDIRDILEPFTQKALIWRNAIARGETPPPEMIRAPAGSGGGGLFGIR